jgi:hypothetical protein
MTAAGLFVGLHASPGSVVLAPSGSILGLTVPVIPAAVLLAGTAATMTLSPDLVLVAEPAAVAVTTTPAILRITLPGTPAALAITGSASTVFAVTMPGAPGAVTMTGENTALRIAGVTLLLAEPGSVAITSGVGTTFAITMAVTPGSVALTGAGSLVVTLHAEPGEVMLTGEDSALILTIPPPPIITTTVVVVPGRFLGRTLILLETTAATAGHARLVVHAVVEAGTRIVGVAYLCTTAFGTSLGLTAVDIGLPDLQDRWGHAVGITEGDTSGYGVGLGASVDCATAVDLWVSALGGVFDAVGACTLSVTWERAAVP